MKKIFVILASAVLALTAVSCQKMLDIPQKGVVNQDEYYKTDTDCEAATTALYNMFISSDYRTWFWDWILTSYVSDDTYLTAEALNAEAKHQKTYFSMPLSDSELLKAYKAWFFVVYRANLIIDNFKDGTTAIQKRAVAEAKVLRSLAYTRLIGLWGNPPKVDHVLSTAEEFRQPNGDPAELWNFAITSLKEAVDANVLPSKSGVNDKTQVRVTQEFAWALKGKCEVFAGKYADAKVSLKKVIDSGKYDLVSSADMATLLKPQGNWCCESVFEENLQDPGSGWSTSNGLSDQFPAYCMPRFGTYGFEPGSWAETNVGSAWGHFHPSEGFINAIIAHEGKNSARFKAWIKSYEDLMALGMKHLETNDPTASASTEIPLALVNYCAQECCGYWLWKFAMAKSDWMTPTSYKIDRANQKFMRYAEVLLLYAEACANAGDDGSGVTALNKVQERAGAPKTALTMENVKAERRFEFIGEGFRFIDLVRWGDAPTALADHYTKVPVFYGYKPGTTTYDIRYFEVGAQYGQRKFQKGKDEYFPYPSTEVAANPNLKQNPGW